VPHRHCDVTASIASSVCSKPLCTSLRERSGSIGSRSDSVGAHSRETEPAITSVDYTGESEWSRSGPLLWRQNNIAPVARGPSGTKSLHPEMLLEVEQHLVACSTFRRRGPAHTGASSPALARQENAGRDALRSKSHPAACPPGPNRAREEPSTAGSSATTTTPHAVHCAACFPCSSRGGSDKLFWRIGQQPSKLSVQAERLHTHRAERRISYARRAVRITSVNGGVPQVRRAVALLANSTRNRRSAAPFSLVNLKELRKATRWKAGIRMVPAAISTAASLRY